MLSDQENLTPREQVLNEIKNTEKSFLMDMQVLHDNLTDLLKINSIPDHDRQILVSFNAAIKGIIDTNLLKKILESPTFEEGRTDTDLSEAFKNGDLFYNQCLATTKSQVLVLDVIERLSKTNSQVRKKLEDQKKTNSNLHMSGYIVKPIQRICKYPLLLRELIKNTSDSEIKKLKDAYNKIDEEVTKVNEMQARYGNIRHARVGFLVDQAQNEFFSLLKFINDLKTQTTARDKLIKKIEAIYTDPSIGWVEKLSRVKWTMQEKEFKGLIPKTIQNNFDHHYNQLKQIFSKQLLTPNQLTDECKQFEKQISSYAKMDKKQGYPVQVKKYHEFILYLKQELDARKESVKMNNTDNLAVQKLADRKIKEYTSKMKVIEQKIKPLPALPSSVTIHKVLISQSKNSYKAPPAKPPKPVAVNLSSPGEKRELPKPPVKASHSNMQLKISTQSAFKPPHSQSIKPEERKQPPPLPPRKNK